jgi:hypothetical protein
MAAVLTTGLLQVDDVGDLRLKQGNRTRHLNPRNPLRPTRGPFG